MNDEYRQGFKEVQKEAYWSLPRVLIGILVLMVVGFGITFLSTGGDLALFRFWQPKIENAKRVVFENTQSYIEGKEDYISRMRLQYEEAATGSATKASLRTLILSEASTVDVNQLNPDLQNFIQSLKGQL